MADEQRIIRIPANVLSRDLQGEAVLLHLDTGEYFGLDEVGARIWQLIGEMGNQSAVQAAMVEEFDVDEASAAADLQHLLDELAARRLVEIVTA